MKTINNKLFPMMAAISLSIAAHAGFYDNIPESLRTYVNPEDVQLNNSSIYVWDKEGWILVDAIYCDSIGLYYESYTLADPAPEHWVCPLCDSYNFNDWTSCYNCGWPY